MNHRILTSTTGLAGLTAVLGMGALFMPVAGQAPTAQKTAAKAWTLPRTVDGQPEIQGYWTNNTYVPLERAAGVNKQFFTKEEAEASAKQNQAREEQQTTPGTTGDVHYDFTQFGLDKSQNNRPPDLRTGMITDPPDGRIPARSSAFTDRQNARRTPRAPGGQYDTVRGIPIGSRCIIGSIGQPIPMFPQGYNSNYQIVQAKDSVMILYENIGDVRIVYLDNRPAPPKEVTQWMGVSRGHWDKDTLIVETTNFNERLEGRHASLQGVSADFKLIEKFKRVGPDDLSYEVVINDPSSFAAPWTAEVPFIKINGPIFEPACHEGNYGIANTLAGARLAEKTASDTPQAAAAPAGGARGAGGTAGGGGARGGGGGARGGAGGGAPRGAGGPGGAAGPARGGNQ